MTGPSTDGEPIGFLDELGAELARVAAAEQQQPPGVMTRLRRQVVPPLSAVRAIAIALLAVFALGGIAYALPPTRALIDDLAGRIGGDASRREPIPPDVVALVGDAEISRTTLESRAQALRRAQAKAAKTPGVGHGHATADQMRQQALTDLIIESALEQEAADRGIEVTAEELEQQWGAINQQANATTRRHLRGQSKRDILNRIRTRLLTIRIEGDVKEKAGGGIEGDDAVQRFRNGFTTRWREQTICQKREVATWCESVEEDDSRVQPPSPSGY